MLKIESKHIVVCELGPLDEEGQIAHHHTVSRSQYSQCLERNIARVRPDFDNKMANFGLRVEPDDTKLCWVNLDSHHS